ncbi:MAG: hypothetical protein WC285_04500 [Candidatus Gracilibacteria bacterium]
MANFCFAAYKTFAGTDFYQKDLVKSAHDFIVYESQRYIDFQPITKIKKSDFSALMDEIVTTDDLNSVMEDVIRQVKTLEIGENGAVQFDISLKWLSEKGDVLTYEITNYLFENLPKCDFGAIPNVAEFNCIPVDMPKEDFAGIFKSIFDREFISNLPDSYNLQFNVPSQFSGINLSAFFHELVGKLFLVLFGSLLLIWVLIGLLAFSPKIIVVKRMAKTLFLASLVTVLSVMFLNIFIPVIFDKLIHSLDINILGYNAWMSVYILFVGAFTMNLLKIVFPLAIISLGFWIFGMIYSKNNHYGSTEVNTRHKELH